MQAKVDNHKLSDLMRFLLYLYILDVYLLR